MKAIRAITVLFTFAMLFSVVVFIKLNREIVHAERDIVYYNEQLHKVVRAYEGGVSPERIEDEYECKIILSSSLDDPELIEEYKIGSMILDLVVDGECIGKVAWRDTRDDFIRWKNDYIKAVAIVWLSVLVCGYLLLFVIYFNLIRPIDEMNKYAEEIAKGNLDVSIPVHKHNLFGGFVEAFDIMREQLKEFRRREIEAEIARKELVSSLSHDIKTPLAVIKATCEVLEVKIKRSLNSGIIEGIIDNVSGILGVNREGSTDRAAELKDSLAKVAVISGKADTITAIMNDMMHANLEDLEKIEVCPAEESSLVINQFFEELHDYGKINMKNTIPPCLVYMDRIRMEQVVDNIVGNSYKYAGTDIDVSFDEPAEMDMADGKKGRFIRIRIADRGPGVCEDDLPLVAEKYYRGSNSTGKTGYGLGLYLVRCYMEKQGGGMDYYNDNGFVVELLLKKV